MAKLTRKTQKLFAKNVDKGVFGSFKDGTPTTTTDLDLIQSSDYLNGWIEGYKDNNGDKQAAIEEQNALKYVNDYQNAYLLQEGIAEYDAGTEYHIDSMVKENGTGLIYKSLINTNIGQALSDASKWRKLGNLDQANNVVIVKQESDFKNQDASNIYLRDTNTMYYISVSQLIITKNIVCDLDDLSVAFVGSGLPNTQIIFAATSNGFSNTSGKRVKYLYWKNLRFSGATGTTPLATLTGHPTNSLESEVVCSLCQFENFSGATFINMTGVFWLGVKQFQVGELIYDNVSVVNHINFVGRHFVSTGNPFYTFKTNLRQANISSSAFFQAKGESILNVDPAILPTSGLSVGAAVPYQGDVFGGIIQFADLGGGQTRVIVAGGHSFENSDVVNIAFTANYNGSYTVSNVINIDPTFQFGTFDITATFVADDAQGVATLLDGSNIYIDNFFKQGVIDDITSVTDSGGLALFTTTGTAPTTGQSLFIKGTNNYDQGGYAVNVTGTTFTLLDSFGVAVPFTSAETPANAIFNTGSLDQTNNVVTTNNTGGIIPDSQTLGNNILTSTIAFPATTTLIEVVTGTWLSDETERFKATSTGSLIYTGKTTATVSISAKVIAQKTSGTTAELFVNVMRKDAGQPSFVEISNHPSTRGELLSSRANTYPITTIIDSISTGDEIAIGIAGDSSFTVDIFSIDMNIKK